MDTPVAIVLVVVVLALFGVALWLYLQKRRSDRLRKSFGPEYDRARQEHPDRRATDRALAERQERVEKLHIRALLPEERDRFHERWRAAQVQFVDDPAGATRAADGLVAEVMQARGYPVGDFEQRAADVSVDHPRVVEHFRAAHAIVRRHERENDHDAPDSEGLRQAFVDYRALFDDLLVDDDLVVKASEPTATQR